MYDIFLQDLSGPVFISLICMYYKYIQYIHVNILLQVQNRQLANTYHVIECSLVSFYIIKKTYVIEGSLVSFYIIKKTYHVIEGSLVSFYIIKKTYHVIEGSLVSFYIIKKIHVLKVYILQCHIFIYYTS